jgi:Uncharacterized protein conserved in bacteria
MKLIVNADDFGYSRAVNYGITDAHNLGIVTSTTAMVNMKEFDQAVMLAKENLKLGVGIHLNLTTGKALTEANKTITDPKGNFLKISDLKEKIYEINLNEIETEFEEQIEKFLKAGLIPTHFDSHHHVHMLPRIFDIFIKLALKYNVPVRTFKDKKDKLKELKIKSPDLFINNFHGEEISIDFIKNIIKNHKNTNKIIEIMSHPGYVDDTLIKKSSYNINRIKEQKILTSKELIEYIKNNQIELINFKNL